MEENLENAFKKLDALKNEGKIIDWSYDKKKGFKISLPNETIQKINEHVQGLKNEQK